MPKIEIPTDILDIIFSYKKQLDLSNVFDQIEKSKKTCMNCDKTKICLYKCTECSLPVCYECRYSDLNEEFVDENSFYLFYECDKCQRYYYDINLSSGDEDENYNDDLYYERYERDDDVNFYCDIF